LEQAASTTPPTNTSPALTEFAEAYQRKRADMQGTAKIRDVFNASAIDDNEGTETRYGMQPTALLIILPCAPVEQGGQVTWELPDGSTRTHRINEFDYPLAKALQSYATRIPAYLVKEQLRQSPDWLKQHIDSGVLAIRATDSTNLQLYPSPESPYSLAYRHDLGITYEKNEFVPEPCESEDFWY
jgi:hypothetical protein